VALGIEKTARRVAYEGRWLFTLVDRVLNMADTINKSAVKIEQQAAKSNASPKPSANCRQAKNWQSPEWKPPLPAPTFDYWCFRLGAITVAHQRPLPLATSH
jgi:hypothetical protein